MQKNQNSKISRGKVIKKLKSHPAFEHVEFDRKAKIASINFPIKDRLFLSHLFHQIHQLVDEVYQKLRAKKGPLVVLWNDLKVAIKMIIFDSWDQLLNYLLSPPKIYASQLMTS